MAGDARIGALTPEQAERFASVIRPLWEAVETSSNIPPAAPSGPRELFGAPDESILGPPPSAQYQTAARASQPPSAPIRLDQTLVMASPAGTPSMGQPMPPRESPFTKTIGMADAPPLPPGPFGRPGGDLRFPSYHPPDPPLDPFPIEDNHVAVQKKGRGLFIVAIVLGVGVGGLLASRFLGANPDATTTTGTSGTSVGSSAPSTVAPAPSPVTVTVTAPSAASEPAGAASSASAASTEATAGSTAAALPSNPTAATQVGANDPLAGHAARPRQPKNPEAPTPMPRNPPRAAVNSTPPAARTAAPPPAKTGGIVRDAPF